MPNEFYFIRLIHGPTRRPCPGERVWDVGQLLQGSVLRFLRARTTMPFVVYRVAVGEGLGAYFRRVRVMLLTTVTFWAHVFFYHFALIRSEGALTDVRGWWRLFRFLCNRRTGGNDDKG